MIYFILNLKLSGLELVAFLLAYVCAMLIAITAHEFSHAFVADKFGDLTPRLNGRLSLNPIKHFDLFGFLSFLVVGFGWAKPVPIDPFKFRNYNRGRRLVALSGILTNLVFAIIFSCAFFFSFEALALSSNLFLNFLGYFFRLSYIINLSLAIFNLLPIYPLDGFKFLETFFKPDNGFVLFMQRWGSLILLLFILTPLFDMLYALVVSNITNWIMSFWGLF